MAVSIVLFIALPMAFVIIAAIFTGLFHLVSYPFSSNKNNKFGSPVDIKVEDNPLQTSLQDWLNDKSQKEIYIPKSLSISMIISFVFFIVWLLAIILGPSIIIGQSKFFQILKKECQ